MLRESVSGGTAIGMSTIPRSTPTPTGPIFITATGTRQ
jgi:hypothetical protein